MFGNSPFGNEIKEPELNLNAKIVVVSDMFVEDYVGGAELTTQALIDSCPFEVQKLKSSEVNMEVLEKLQDKYWVFGNFSGMSLELLPTIVANMNYSVLEYDYKYCKWRSPQKHKASENVECDCHQEMHGKIISAFYYGAKSLWWMSEAQMDHYHKTFPFLQERENVVLSSVFDDKFFATVNVLNEQNKNQERKGWVVLGSQSWVKGFSNAEAYCKENNLDYEVLWNIPYEEVLAKLSLAEGFVYLPEGWDTCPRMVIEAKMLGCKLVLNDNVQHKDEIWFETEDPFDTSAYLYAARDRFWQSINDSMNWTPKISGYTTTKDCIKHDYPWTKSIESMLGFCSEVVVVDGGSEDGTWEKLKEWSEKEDKLKVYLVERDWDHPRFAVFDGDQKAEARARCTGDFLWQQDADEIVHEDDYNKVIELCKHFPSQCDLVSLPVIEYWGGPEKVRMDINPWKWRISRNMSHITHGIPAALRKTDDDGNLYSSPGTDGCDYVHNESYEVIPHASFYTNEVHQARLAALSGHEQALTDYKDWFNKVVEMLPCVHHYSWFNLPRKIRTYRDYWSQHWQSLYDISQEDTADNNMFFQKKWSDVTEEDIESLSAKLANEMGGWVFHNPVDFSKPTPHVVLDRSQPAIMTSENNEQ